MFSLADALYSFYSYEWIELLYANSDYIEVVDEEWRLEDKSNATLNVDTDCMQLLANVLDHPICPLEDLPPETIEQREQCRVQLWDDMVQRSPHIPVTSYLAYTQRVNVNLCLLAWMAVNSLGICQDVPFSMMQSVHDARCYFDTPDNQSCLESKDTYAICSVSRAIVLLKCRDFFFVNPPKLCGVYIYRNGSYSMTLNAKWYEGGYKGYGKPTEITLNYKESLNSATLKYKDFKIDSLRHLEISFIAVNILFRLLTAGLYTYFPHLGNLPGKIFLSFQITGIIQITCSEILYRMAGIPDLSTMIVIDSALTLLSCIWLNSFCYQMYSCIRHLRLPNDLLPAETRKIFCHQMLLALIVCSVLCTASIALEKTIIRIGFHQAQGIAQFVYYVHIASMMQGPLLFILFICNKSTLPVLKNRILAWWDPDIIVPGQELCSSAERNLANRINKQSPIADSSF
ncbi:uncharacterized protein LOC126442681 [Schistocerca serialis cubense]|uniref:uncharacterized protein LOC126442681 n=1 Tax=Schistocerca serialis cubense TaxID=2023355 RepID=UPI00214ECF7E|nr:uncharacterized protein LOC126442681 [Schistocerca serialis cubense]